MNGFNLLMGILFVVAITIMNPVLLLALLAFTGVGGLIALLLVGIPAQANKMRLKRDTDGFMAQLKRSLLGPR